VKENAKELDLSKDEDGKSSRPLDRPKSCAPDTVAAFAEQKGKQVLLPCQFD
jgi:hypothetical protein